MMATISVNNVLRQLAIPRYFSLTFEIYGVVKTLNVVDRNSIIDIKDSVTGDSLFAISTTETNSVRVTYGGSIMYPYGPPIFAPNLVTWTAFTVTVSPLGFSIVSSADSGNPMSTTIAATETEGNVYKLFASNSYETSATGNLRNFYIQGEFEQF